MKLSQIIEVLPEDFDRSAMRPEGGRTTTVKMSTCRGRSGNLVVIQMRSSIGGTAQDSATLRSLGLKGLNSASLRWDDESTQGMIHSVKHLVGVVRLEHSYYTNEVEEVYESVKYGTNSQPGETWRTHRGEYFGYDTEGQEIVVYMSTRSDFKDVLAGIQACGLEIEPSSQQTFIGVRDRDVSVNPYTRGLFSTVILDIDPDEVVRAVLPCRTVGKPTPGSRFVTITWQAPYARFHDMTRESSEIGIIASTLDGDIVGDLKTRFAEESVKSNCTLYMGPKQGRMAI